MAPPDENLQSQSPGPNVSDDEFRRVVETLPLLVWTALPDGSLDYVSPQWIKKTGVPAGKQVGTRWQELLHPDDWAPLCTAWHRAIENQDNFAGEFRMRCADGLYRWFKSQAAPQRDGHGEITQWFGTNTEIDRDKWQEHSLRAEAAAEARLQKIMDTVPGVIFSFRQTPDGKASLPYASSLVKSYYPLLAPDDLALDATPLFDALCSDDLRIVQAALSDSAHAMSTLETSWRVQHPEKGEIWLEAFAVPEREADGSVIWHGFAHEITARKRAEESLHFLRAAVDQCEVGVLWSNRDDRIAYVNEYACRLLGYSAKELLGKRVGELMLDASQSEQSERWNHLKNERRCTFEERHQRKDGTSYLAEVTTSYVELGGQEYIFAFFRDVTQNKADRETLAASEAKFRAVVDQAGDAILLFSEDARILEANQKAREIFGYSNHELLGQYAWGTISSDAKDEILDRWRGIHIGETITREGVGRRKDGTFFANERRVSRIQIGNSPYFLALFRDVSERKTLEKRLNLVQAAIEASDTAFFWGNEQGEILFANRFACEVLGYAPGELIGMHVWDFRANLKVSDWSVNWEDLKARKFRHRETTYRHKDGYEIPFEVRSTYIEFEGEGHVFAHSRDIRERKLIEDRLRFTQFAVDRCATGISWVSSDGKVLYANDHYCKMLGYTEEEIVDLRVWDLNRNLDENSWQAHWQRLRETGNLSLQATHRRRDGELIFTELTTSHITYEGVEYAFASITDVTERKKAEQALRESREFLRTLLDVLPQRIFWKDRQGKYLGANRAFMTDAGTTDLIGKDDQEMPWKGDQADFFQECDRRIMESGLTQLDIIEPITTADGKAGWLNTSKTPLRRADGEVYGILGTYIDVTKIKESEIAVRDSATRLRAYFDNSGVGMCMAESETGRLLAVNRRYREITGYTEAELLQKSFLDLTHPDDRGQALDYLRTVVPSPDTELRFEKRYLRKNGETIWLDVDVKFFRVEQDEKFQALVILQDVTARKYAEMAMAESERRFRVFFDSANVGMTQADPATGRILRANPKFCEMLGYAAEELYQLSFKDISYPGDRLITNQDFLESAELAECGIRLEKRFLDRSGRVIWAEVTVSQLMLENGQVDRMIGVVHDITQRKQAEMALQLSEATFRAFFENSSIGMAQSDLKTGAVVRVNRRMSEIVGYSESELVGNSNAFLKLTHPDDRAETAEGLAKLRVGAIDEFRREKRYLHKSGKPVWVEVTTKLVRDVDDHAIRTMSTVQDITERKFTELSLRESELRHRAIIDSALDAVITIDHDNRVIGWNRRAENVFGWSAEEVLGSDIVEKIIPVAWRSAHREGLRRHVESGGSHILWQRREVPALRRDGTEFPAEIAVTAAELGGQKCFTAFFQDISERKKNEEELHRLAAVVENSDDAIFSTDRDGRVITWNPGAERLYGRCKNEMIGAPVQEIIPLQGGDEVTLVQQSVMDNCAARHYETKGLCKEGERDISLTVSPLRGDGGQIIGTSCIARDITQKKSVERELLQHRDHLRELVGAQTKDLRNAKEAAEAANRAKTEFLANMSHELRTPMHAILSFAKRGEDVALRTSPEKLRGYFSNINTGGTRLLNLLNDLLDLSKLEAGRMRFDMAEQDLREVVDAVAEELTQLVNEKHIGMVINLLTDDFRACCDSTAMHQVLRNVIGNAIKFSPVKGKITISLRAAELPDGRQVAENGTVNALAIEVSDEGCGIPETERDAVFDKFVQSSKTKSKAGGTGLGLAICREIMVEHGGTIEVVNNPVAGVTFAIKLPRQAVSNGAPPHRAEAWQRTETEL